MLFVLRVLLVPLVPLPTGRVLMSDPNWNKGDYYDGQFPFVGMKVRRMPSS